MAPTQWLDDEEQHAWRAYLRMNKLLVATLNRQLQADSKLSLSDFEVLVSLTDVADQRLRVNELAKAVQWEKSRLSHQIARMERRGLIAREECADDGRGAFVVLTDTGREAIEAAAPGHVDAVRELFFDALQADGVAALSTMSEGVLARLEQQCSTHCRSDRVADSALGTGCDESTD
jgi:DNA-binding MarR family transcriptional regulator